jgi:hypothetical protein
MPNGLARRLRNCLAEQVCVSQTFGKPARIAAAAVIAAAVRRPGWSLFRCQGAAGHDHRRQWWPAVIMI